MCYLFLDGCITGTPFNIESRVDFTQSKHYYRDCQQYTSIPRDIPIDTKRAYIRGNPITGFYSGSVNHLSELEYLYLEYNTISTIQVGALTGLNKLQRLYLNNNAITVIQEDLFHGLSELQWLYLRFNSITEIEAGALSGLNKLQGLLLRDNSITVIPEQLLHGLSELRELDFSSNAFAQIPNVAWSGLQKLRSVTFYGNAITEIQENIFNGVTLTSYLTLSYNKIHTVHPQAFVGANIPRLSMDNNDLTEINTGSFTDISSLTELDVSSNKLHTLEPDIFPSGLSELKVKMHDNDLTTFPSTVFSGSLPTKLTLTLSDNPLVCDSSMCWLKEGEEEERITYDGQGTPSCTNYQTEWANIDLDCKTGIIFFLFFLPDFHDYERICTYQNRNITVNSIILYTEKRKRAKIGCL